jgi:hypothetical protein
MKIISNLSITGSVNPSGIFYIPRVGSESALSGSITGSLTSSIGLYADPTEIIPRVVDGTYFDGQGSTPIKCEATNSIDTAVSLQSFYNCIVTASRSSVWSNFDLYGTTTDRSGSIYEGLSRRNYTLTEDTGVIHHTSNVFDGESEFTDFEMELVPGQASRGDRIKNQVKVYVNCPLGTTTVDTINQIAERFRRMMCRCLKNGQFIALNVHVYCSDTKRNIFSGMMQFEKCYGKCNTKTDVYLIPMGPIINNDGKSYSDSGYEVPWSNATAFNYELTTITGSQSQPSASGALTASTTPYLVLPSAPATPQVYYPFGSTLVSSSIKALPGLVYFDTNASTLFVYDGTGSWSPAGSSKYTASIGNGTASMFTVTHSKNTRDLHVTVRETSTPYEIVFPTINITSANTALIDFTPTVPSLNQYTVIIS